MKKIMGTLALVLLTGVVFGQDLVAPQEGRGPGMMGPGRGGFIDWKLGTVVTTEYKKLTGTVAATVSGAITLKADGVEYLLMVPRRSLTTVKAGDTVSVEGPVSTVKSDTKVQPWIDAFKLTINGKEIDVRLGSGRGFGDDDRGRGNDAFGRGR